MKERERERFEELFLGFFKESSNLTSRKETIHLGLLVTSLARVYIAVSRRTFHRASRIQAHFFFRHGFVSDVRDRDPGRVVAATPFGAQQTSVAVTSTTTTTTTTTSRSYDYCYYYYCLCYSSLAFEPFSSLLFCSCFPVSTFLSPPREGEGNDRRHEFISVSKERKINSNDFGLSSTSFAAQVSNKFDMESNASSSAWVSGSCL